MTSKKVQTETISGTHIQENPVHWALLIGMLVFLPACQPPATSMSKLDQEGGVAGFVLGDSLYEYVFDRSAYAALDHEVLEFESFGSRFADDRPVMRTGNAFLYGTRISQVRAGIIDGQVYAYLLQLDADSSGQKRLQDSLIAHYGMPSAVLDTMFAGAGASIAHHQVSWKGDRVGLEYGRGAGFAEILVYDSPLRARRMQVQDSIFTVRARPNPTLSDLESIGEVRLNMTRPYAQWRYRYQGKLTQLREGSFGKIDYAYVQPFFEVQGRSLYGLDMAFVNLNFQAGTDSLNTVEVRFENTQGQTVGFMDMLNIMERKLGPHAYSDTLHTKKGAFRRALWYGDELAVTLEENRFRPQSRSRSDVSVTFALNREPVSDELLERMFRPAPPLVSDTLRGGGAMEDPAIINPGE